MLQPTDVLLTAAALALLNAACSLHVQRVSAIDIGLDCCDDNNSIFNNNNNNNSIIVVEQALSTETRTTNHDLYSLLHGGHRTNSNSDERTMAEHGVEIPMNFYITPLKVAVKLIQMAPHSSKMQNTRRFAEIPGDSKNNNNYTKNKLIIDLQSKHNRLVENDENNNK